MICYVKYSNEQSRPRIVTMQIFRQAVSILRINFSYDAGLK